MNDYPYRECKNCQDISSCKNLDIEQDGFGTPIPPEDCPKKDIIKPIKKKYHE